MATTLTGLFAAPLAVVTVAAPAHAAPVDVQILATNDFHGRLVADGSVAGAAQFAGAVTQLESENPNTVFAAAGDLIGARATGREPDRRATIPFATDLGPPQVVFTDPEVAAVGLTDEQARGRGIRTRVVDLPMDAAAGPGLQAEGYQGHVRVVVDADEEVVVGATLVGQDVADLVHAATVAVVGRVPLPTLWHAVPSYPTMSEIWLRVLEDYGL